MFWGFLCLVLTVVSNPIVDSRFVQLAPVLRPSESCVRSPGKTRAVVLIPGLSHPLARPGTAKPKFHSYEHPDSPLVKRLSQSADVFGFAYAETAPVTDVLTSSGFTQAIQALRDAGYTEIVLIGCSAGGLIARQLVEEYPRCGVTKVIQVCTPNAGTAWANAGRDEFVRSLTTKARRAAPERSIPETVQFACVVGTGLYYGDGIVSVRSQWPEDLQEQGIPARMIRCGHLVAAHSPTGIALIAELVEEDQPRWDSIRVAAMRKALRKFWLP
jgi:pimeloyl-ACP methyl ester carboxylesterase